ncbi:MAG: sigma-54-dependent Fis family transcriptional regulator, partial [Deltaproteobacteria bacterium]|nr:sigma-54-dependent Fis family transcriptional regulator [Deltaproteobacteria bacterium]
GKGLIAEVIHRISGLKGDFISVNVAGLDDNLFSDTLYGHIKGAFSGAATNRSGLVEKATGGTLFLDEIGDLSIQSQVKLLNLMEEGRYYSVGSDIPKKAHVKIITATNKSIRTLQSDSSFRSDLYYRLQTHHIEIPPLRERLDDLPLLMDHFLIESANSLGKKKPTPPRELIHLLSSYNFPGNIRELQSMVFDAVSHHQSRILSMEQFKKHIREHGGSADTDPDNFDKDTTIFSGFKELPTLKDARKQLVTEALTRSGDISGVASDLLGISKSGLNKIIQRDRA